MNTVREMRREIAKLTSQGTIKQIGQAPKAIAGTIAMMNKEQCEDVLADSQIHWDDLKSAVEKREGYLHQKRVGADNGSGDSEPRPIGGDRTRQKQEGEKTPAERQGEKWKASQENADANIEEKMNQINDNQESGDFQLPKGNDDEQFVTTKGVKSTEEVQDMIGIKPLAKAVDALSKQGIELSKALYKDNKKDIRLCAKEISDVKRENSDRIKEVWDASKNMISKLEKKIEEGQGGEIKIISHEPKDITLKDEHYHPQFKNIAQMLPIAKQVMLVGDAGTGKTFVANQVADALELKFKHISCSGGMSEGMLIGKMLFDGTFVSTDFLDCYENGGVFLLDEMDSADANLLVVLNSALANGYLSVPNRKESPTAKRHDSFFLIACCNTFGTGNGSRVYAGRNRLDGATLDRFYTIDFDYDRKLETKLAGTQQVMKDAIWRLRDEVKRQRLDKVVSTRWIQQGQMTLDNTDKSLGEFIEEKTLSWTDAEKKKCGVAGIIEGAK